MTDGAERKCYDCDESIPPDSGHESKGWWTNWTDAVFCDKCWESLMAALEE
jgi:hypothetical protein